MGAFAKFTRVKTRARPPYEGMKYGSKMINGLRRTGQHTDESAGSILPMSNRSRAVSLHSKINKSAHDAPNLASRNAKPAFAGHETRVA